MVKKSVTLEDLARMVQAGFQGTATKQDLDIFRKETDERFRSIVEGFDIVRADIHDIKITLGPLVRTVAEMENELQKFHLRLSRLERKTGIVK